MVFKRIFINLIVGILGLWLVFAYGFGFILYPYVGLCVASAAMFWFIFEAESRSSLQTSPKGVWLWYEVTKSILWNISETLKEFLFGILICVVIGFEFIGFTISQIIKEIRSNPNTSFFGVILIIFSFLTIGPLGIWWLYYQAPAYVGILVVCAMILWALLLIPFWSWLYKALEVIVPMVVLLFCLIMISIQSLFKPKEKNE